MVLLALNALLVALICGSVYCGRNTVILPQGTVSGAYNYRDGYRAYLGIPYATVRDRYQDPGEPPTWSGTFRADTEATCKQFDKKSKSIIGTENCLTANVFTPIEKGPELLSVIVFMHGGGFFKGSNTNMLYNPKYLIRKNVVIVNINYRLGAFGFLCLKTKGAPGNIGLKDQVAALKWVKQNIAYFGGNPESVTLFGESSTASATVFLILSQAAKGLFQRAIILSGSVNTPQFFDRHPIESAAAVAARLGYNTTNTDELLAIFRNSTADDIVSASYVDSTNNALAPYILMLCKEDPQVSENPIITRNPQELINSVKDISNLSIIMGYNDKEGIMWASEYDTEGLNNLDSNFTSAIPRSFTFDSNENKQLFINAIRKFYFNDLSTDYCDLINYYTDTLLMYPSVVTMEAFMTNPNITMYNYYFKYDSCRNLRKLQSRLHWVPGADHADELFYLFDPIEYQNSLPIPSDLEFIDIMTSLWTNFAKTGTPSTKSISWMPSEDHLRFLKLDEKIEMIDLPNRDRIDFWRRTEKNYGLRYP